MRELVDRKQDIVSLSITEAEHIADCDRAKDAAAMRQLTSEMNRAQIPLPEAGDQQGLPEHTIILGSRTQPISSPRLHS
jgi:hypothetical protein